MHPQCTSNAPPRRQIIIIVEGIYSMEGEATPLAAIVALKKRYGAYLYRCVDRVGLGCMVWPTQPALLPSMLFDTLQSPDSLIP